MKVKYKTFAVVLRYQEVGVSNKYYDVMLEAWGKMEFSMALVEDIINGPVKEPWNIKMIEKLLKKDEVMPKWYGLAYRNFDKDVYVAYPIPINLIVAGSRWLSAKVRFEWPHLLNDRWEGTLRNGFKEGFNHGHAAGFIEATKAFGMFMPTHADDTLRETIATNKYKEIFGVPESELLVSFTLSKKIVKPSTKDMSGLQNSKPDMSGVANASDIKVHYESPEKNWTVVEVDQTNKEYKSIFEKAKAMVLPEIYPSQEPISDLTLKALDHIKQEQHEQLEKQIVWYIKNIMYSKLMDAAQAKKKLYELEPAVIQDTGMTIAQLLEKHKNAT